MKETNPGVLLAKKKSIFTIIWNNCLWFFIEGNSNVGGESGSLLVLSTINRKLFWMKIAPILSHQLGYIDFSAWITGVEIKEENCMF